MRKKYSKKVLSSLVNDQDPLEIKRFSQNQVNQILEEAKLKNKKTALTYAAIITHLLIHFKKINDPILLRYDEIKKEGLPQIEIEKTKEGIVLQINKNDS